MQAEQSENRRKVHAVTALAENFGKEIQPALLKMWLKLLKPYAASEVEAAAMQVIENYEYKTMPAFAVIKKYLDRQRGIIPEEKAVFMSANAEWGNLLEQIEKYGAYRKPDFCETTDYVLRSMGGYAAACAWPLDKMEWKRKEFVEAWVMACGNVGLMKQGAQAITGPLHVRAILGQMPGIENAGA